jgi:hypothetical protein
MITSGIQTITPEYAQSILSSCNNSNRQLRHWWSEGLAAAIKRGEWVTTHQGLAFTEDGELVDGQHRLMAVVIAKTPVQMMVSHGVPKTAFSVMDIGAKRNIADTTGLSRKTAEASRLAATIVLGGNKMTTPTQVKTLASAGFGDVHDRLIAHCSTTLAYYSAAPMRTAACVLVMDGHNESYVFGTYSSLILQTFENASPVVCAFAKQVNTNRVNSANGAADALARGLKVFNPANRNLNRVMVNSEDTAAAYDYIRRVIGRSMGK